MFQLASANDQPAPATTICFLFFLGFTLEPFSFVLLESLKIKTPVVLGTPHHSSGQITAVLLAAQ